MWKKTQTNCILIAYNFVIHPHILIFSMFKIASLSPILIANNFFHVTVVLLTYVCDQFVASEIRHSRCHCSVYQQSIWYLIYNFPYRLYVRINPLPSESRLRCCDRYIRCHQLLAVKPLSPREHTGRRVGKGGTLGSVYRPRPSWFETAVVYRQSVIRSLGAEWLSLPKIIGRCMRWDRRTIKRFLSLCLLSH